MRAYSFAFRIPIARIEGRFTIGQNRSEVELHRIQVAHAAGSPEEQSLAAWIERLIG